MSQIPESQTPRDATERTEDTRRIATPPPQMPMPRRASQGRRPAPRAAYPPPENVVAPPQAYPPPASPARRRRAARTTLPSESGLYLPWWSLVIMVGVVGAVAFGLMLAVSILADPETPGDQIPRIQVVTSQPTLSQDFAAENAPPAGQPQFWPTAIPQAQPSATVALPTPAPSPSLPPGEFQIGATVQVVGVSSSGLNVRSTPGFTGDPLFLAAENEVFAIVGGPQNADDMEWWKIQDPDDPERTGWAARNYLTAASP